VLARFCIDAQGHDHRVIRDMDAVQHHRDDVDVVELACREVVHPLGRLGY
jgi:hypothetical protein